MDEVKMGVVKIEDTYELSTRVSNLVGKMLTIIDASTPDQEQRTALKKIITNGIWDWYHHVLVNYEPETVPMEIGNPPQGTGTPPAL